MQLFVFGGLNLNEFEIRLILRLIIRVTSLECKLRYLKNKILENLHLSEFVIWLIILIMYILILKMKFISLNSAWLDYPRHEFVNFYKY